MKKIFLFLSLAVLAAACQKPVEPSVTLVSPAEMSVATAGESKTVEFTSTVAWTATLSSTSFATIQSGASGEAGTTSTKVVFTENKTNDPRTVTLTIKADTKTATVTFTQLQADALFLVDTDGNKVTSLEIEDDCNEGIIELTTLGNVDITASANADWIKVGKSKGLVQGKYDVAVTLNKSDKARTGVVTFKGADKTATATIKQAAFEPELYFEENSFSIEKGASEFYIPFFANVDYEIIYPEEDWITIIPENGAGKFKATVKENKTYDARNAYLTLISKEPGHTEWVDLDWDGIAETEQQVTVHAYIKQYGSATLTWSKKLTEYTSIATVGGVHHLGYLGGALALTDGAKLHVLDAKTGQYGMGAAVPNVETPTTMATDDAGNLLVASYGYYGGNFDVYYCAPVDETTHLLFSYPHADIYSIGISNLRVKGDVTKNAVVTAVTDVYSYCVYWEIKNGEVQAPAFFALPSECAVWNADRNSCCAPLGTTADDGFIYMGYDGIYECNIYDKTGAKTTAFAFDPGAGSNVNFQCISVGEWNGKKLAAIGVSTYFSWGSCPDVIILDLTSGERFSYLDHLAFDELSCEYIGANDGENASADVKLITDDPNNLGVVMIDALNNVLYRVDYPKQ